MEWTLEFTLGQASDRDLRFNLTVADPAGKFIQATLDTAAEADEAFWGFGEQFTVFNQRGKLLRLINMEQGIFRGTQPESAALNVNVPGSAGDWYVILGSIFACTDILLMVGGPLI